MAKKNQAVKNDAQTEVQGEVQAEVKTPVVAVEILRGRMALPIVYAIKFLDDGTDAELATRYRTTGGKISDIKGDRNFGYIKKDSRFPADDINDATIFAEQLGDAEAYVKDLLSQLVAGTETDAADLKAGRLAARKTKSPKVAADPATLPDPEETEAEEAEEGEFEEDRE